MVLKDKFFEWIKKFDDFGEKPPQAFNRLMIWGLLFVCLGFNVYYRLYPAFFPQLKKEAKSNVLNRLSTGIFSQVDERYPAYNNFAKAQIAEMVFKNTLKDRKGFNREVEKEYQWLKKPFQDPQGNTYLMELDPYQWLRATENIVDHGYPGTTKIKGTSWDMFVLAPVGVENIPVNALFYTTAYLYKAVKLVFNSLSLEVFCFYIQVFYSFIFLLLLYLLVQKIFSPLAAFISISCIGLNSIIIYRSCAGWYKYEILGLIMALGVVWCIIEALKNNENKVKLIFFALAAAIIQFLYMVTWIGWWFITLVVLGFMILAVLNNYSISWPDFKEINKLNKPYFMVLSIFLAVSFLLMYFILKINIFSWIFDIVAYYTNFGSSRVGSVWPNTMYTISELQSLNMDQIGRYFYDKTIFVLAMLSVFFVYLKERRGKRKDFVYLMLFWFAFMLYASMKGVRFLMYLSVPMFIFLGVFLGDILPEIIENKIKNTVLKLALVFGTAFFIVSLLFQVYSSGERSASQIYPMMNSNWQKALDYVKEKSPKDAILNSWWDYGDLFKYFARRRVIFDGQTQIDSISNLMSRVILSTDEDKAVRILRLLNNSSDKAWKLLIKYIPEQFKAQQALEDLLSSNIEESKKILKFNKVGESDAKLIIHYLYDKPAPAYFIVEESMLGKMSNISFLGNWDFKRLYAYRETGRPQEEVLAGLKNIYGMDNQRSRDFYNATRFISSWPGNFDNVSSRYAFHSGVVPGRRDGKFISFDNGLVISNDTKDALLYLPSSKHYASLRKMVFFNNKKEEVIKDNGEYDKTVAVFTKGNDTSAVFMDDALVDSLFVKLYFLGGKSLKHFKPFYADDESRIYIYEIVWD